MKHDRLIMTWMFGPLIGYQWTPDRLITVNYERNQVWVWKNRRGRYKRINVTPATLERIKALAIRSSQ